MSGEDDPKQLGDAPLEQQGSPDDEATKDDAKLISARSAGAVVGCVFPVVGTVVGGLLGGIFREIALALDHPQSVLETPLRRSQTSYQAELPELLQSHRGKWVAYADGKRVRIATTQAELYRHCLKDLGLTHDRFVVRRVVPDSSSQIEFALG